MDAKALDAMFDSGHPPQPPESPASLPLDVYVEALRVELAAAAAVGDKVRVSAVTAEIKRVAPPAGKAKEHR